MTITVSLFLWLMIGTAGQSTLITNASALYFEKNRECGKAKIFLIQEEKKVSIKFECIWIKI